MSRSVSVNLRRRRNIGRRLRNLLREMARACELLHPKYAIEFYEELETEIEIPSEILTESFDFEYGGFDLAFTEESMYHEDLKVELVYIPEASVTKEQQVFALPETQPLKALPPGIPDELKIQVFNFIDLRKANKEEDYVFVKKIRHHHP